MTVPSSSNSIESSPSGRTSRSLITTSLTQTLRKRPGPSTAISCVPSEIDVDAVVAARRAARSRRPAVSRAGGQVDRRQVGAVRAIHQPGDADLDAFGSGPAAGRGQRQRRPRRRWRMSSSSRYSSLAIVHVASVRRDRHAPGLLARPGSTSRTVRLLATSITETSFEMPLVVKSSFSSGVKASCQTRWPTSR